MDHCAFGLSRPPFFFLFFLFQKAPRSDNCVPLQNLYLITKPKKKKGGGGGKVKSPEKVGDWEYFVPLWSLGGGYKERERRSVSYQKKKKSGVGKLRKKKK